MGIFETIGRIRFTYKLIQSETTGTPNEFAGFFQVYVKNFTGLEKKIYFCAGMRHKTGNI
jgi:hypothetical protein